MAGALERLGAVQKSFSNTPTQSQNFLIIGVKRQEMERQLNNMHVQKIFMLTEVLNDKWDEFTKEVFHHALRIIDRLPSKPLTRPIFRTNPSERVYITAWGCEIGSGRRNGLQAPGTGGL